MSIFSKPISDHEFHILKTCKKRRRVTCQDFDWWDLIELVKKTALDRVISKDGRNAGWSHFKLSPRGRRYVEKRVQAEQRR